MSASLGVRNIDHTQECFSVKQEPMCSQRQIITKEKITRSDIWLVEKEAENCDQLQNEVKPNASKPVNRYISFLTPLSIG